MKNIQLDIFLKVKSVDNNKLESFDVKKCKTNCVKCPNCKRNKKLKTETLWVN